MANTQGRDTGNGAPPDENATAATRPLWAETYHVAEPPATQPTTEEPAAGVPAQPTAPTVSSWPAGWYDVPDRVNTRGYWDGERWTGDFVPNDTAAQAAAVTARPVPKNGLIVGLIGFAALAVGSLGSWATAAFASVSGMDGDGKLTMAAAIVGALMLLPGGGVAVLSALAGVAGLGVAIYDISRVSSKASEFTLGGVQIIQVGWGLYVCAGGAVIAIVGALMHRNITTRARREQRQAA
jgi:hypothetical protein